ncbi:MAG TPA: TRAP transporter substrate-binding protein DctP [Spirochaetota bacterium]|nr:TRAP transporter substrate-binding protein DctP [Spirochaetota bacterium]HPI90815.1 TRAP transporter substrate-binding protein DctP [Spirochaetota bacterium]HPR47637.1 TRAP transporter substrate-binding protein DctP [Spirochaetota bacterium]
MKHFLRTGAAALLLIVLVSLPATAVTIKVGSIAPEGSPWDRALKKIASEWNGISGGRLNLKIYPGGIVGSESDMTRKLKIGQIQGAIFTGVGLSYTRAEVISLSLPFLVDNDDELEYLLQKITPYFDTLIEEKGLTVVSWTKAGWVNLFSKKPVVRPNDLKKMPLAVSESDPEMLQSWRSIGFNAVPLSTNDQMTALQSGMIEAFYAPPLVTAAFQWFGIAKNMADLRIAPMIGGFVVSNKTWNEIPDDIKPRLRDATQQVLKDLYDETYSLEKEAIEVMKKNGLVVNNVPREAVLLWKKEAEKGYDAFLGRTFPTSLYIQLQNYIQEYRKRR